MSKMCRKFSCESWRENRKDTWIPASKCDCPFLSSQMETVTTLVTVADDPERWVQADTSLWMWDLAMSLKRLLTIWAWSVIAKAFWIPQEELRIIKLQWGAGLLPEEEEWWFLWEPESFIVRDSGSKPSALWLFNSSCLALNWSISHTGNGWCCWEEDGGVSGSSRSSLASSSSSWGSSSSPNSSSDPSPSSPSWLGVSTSHCGSSSGMMVQQDSNRWRSGLWVLGNTSGGHITVLLAATVAWDESKRALPLLSRDRVGGTDEPGPCNETQGAWTEGPSSREGAPETSWE